MAINENDFNKFINEWDEIADQYPNLLEDKDRFVQFSKDEAFINENNEMFSRTVAFLILSQKFPEKIQPEDLANYLDEFEKFVETWKTRPISSYLFKDSNDSLEDLKEAMEKLFDEISQYDAIKVYPWTTKKEIKGKFDEIRKEQPSWKLRPEQHVVNFKIKALRDAKWKYTEIIKFLGFDNQDVEKMYRRIDDLEKLGKSEDEIDKIIAEEFPLGDFDTAIDSGIQYDAIRKRKKAADYECEKLLKFLKIGK